MSRPLTDARAFVGRERELAELEAHLAAVTAGHGGLVLLGGEPGIGKTRLLDELGARASHRGVAPFWGRCWEEGGAPSYWPWAQVVRAQLRAAGVPDPPFGDGIGGLVARIPELVAAAPEARLADDAELGSEHARFLLFDAVASWFRTVADRAPMLVLIDDLHAADLPSLNLLAFLARELRRTPVLMVGAYREAEASRAPAVSARLATAAREGVAVLLAGLEEREVAQLVAVRAGVQPSAAVVASLHRHTGGNPFFLDELIPLLDTEGTFDFRADRPRVLRAVPGRIQDAVERRVARLSSRCRALLDLASVIGFECTARQLAIFGHSTPAAVLGDLADAAASGIVTVEATRVRFRHALFREALSGALGPARRAALHGDVGRMLRDDPEATCAELAHHFLEAAEGGAGVEPAVDHARRAAAEATARMAYEDAAALYERALSVLAMREPQDWKLQSELLVELGETQQRIGAGVEARKAFESAWSLARRLDSAGPVMARAALGIAGAGPELARVDPAVVRLLEDALHAVGPDDGGMRARLLARLAAELTHAADRSRSQDLSREAVAMAERLGDVRTLGYVLARRYTVLTDPGDAVERRVLASTIVELGHGTADRELEAEGRGWRLLAQLELGDIGGVDGDLEALGRLAGATRHPRYLWLAAMFRAMRALLAARIDDAERLMQDAFALGQRHGDPNASVAYGAQLFMVRRAEGRLDEIAQLMHEVMGGHAADPTWESGMALLHVLLGQLEPARARFVPAYETFLRLPRDDTWLLHLCVLGKTCAALGDRERADELLTRLRPYADRFIVAPPGAVCHGAAARVAGLLAATLERWEESLASLEQAARLNERIGALGWLAETASNQATVLLARDAAGDRDAARGHLVRARVLASRLGLRDVTAKVEQIAARLHDRDGAERPGALRQAFRRDGDDWRVEFGGRVSSLHDSKGVRLLVELLRRPGSQCHAAVLVAAVEGVSPAPDPGTLSTAESERHRVSVTRTVHAVLGRLTRSHPALGEHLARTVRTGTWCAYDPDPRVSTTWEL